MEADDPGRDRQQLKVSEGLGGGQDAATNLINLYRSTYAADNCSHLGQESS